ncbi:MAG: PIN domain-containing protein [Myxococcota bacterium]
MKTFVDTSGFYALLVATEQRHREVTTAFRTLVEKGSDLCTSSYVLVETIALLQHRIGLAPVRDLHRAFVPLLDVRWVDEVLHSRAIARLTREDRRQLSLVDCVSLELLRSEQIDTVLSLDPHLGEEGAALLPAPASDRR